MIVNCAAYEDGLRCGGDLALEDAGEAAKDEKSFVWLGVLEPSAEEFESRGPRGGIQKHPGGDCVEV